MANVFQLSSPYPMPTGLGCNRRDACRLLEVYCGQASELTLVTQVAFHQTEAMQNNASIAQTLQGICRVDLQHLTMLGSCIRQLGARPTYRTCPNGEPVPWTPRFVNYRSSMRDMLEADIRTKERIVRRYNRLIHCIGNTQISALLNRICEDELLHISLLTELLNCYF